MSFTAHPQANLIHGQYLGLQEMAGIPCNHGTLDPGGQSASGLVMESMLLTFKCLNGCHQGAVLGQVVFNVIKQAGLCTNVCIAHYDFLCNSSDFNCRSAYSPLTAAQTTKNAQEAAQAPGHGIPIEALQCTGHHHMPVSHC